MANIQVIENLISDGSIARTLKSGSSSRAAVSVLQETLYHLGFGRALNWDRYGPDGGYGKSTIKAVAAFAKANGIKSDGSSVNAKMGRLLVQRYDFLPEMHHMQDAIDKASLLKQLHAGSRADMAIKVLQEILHELGYDAQLQWEKYGADGDYGNATTAAVKAFGENNNIKTDGKSVTLAMAKKSLQTFKPLYGPDWHKESPKVVHQSLKVSVTSKYAIVEDGEHSRKFRRAKRGYYDYGTIKAEAFINANRAMLKKQGMSDSALNVMIGVSENEGALDAINTWDSAFMSFGMFQWTIGQGKEKGELPALFKKIKAANPDIFEKYYGQHGIDVSSSTNSTYGSLSLTGNVLNQPNEKTQMRAPKWCFLFWKAGQDPVVQAVSLQHAFDRIGTFARSSRFQINGHDVADIVTSEYGMALVLDNHVNRPGYIKSCLTKAMDAAGLKGSDPKKWTTDHERKLIAQYLRIRANYGKYPMTHADKRAAVTKKYLRKGIISDARGSFK